MIFKADLLKACVATIAAGRCSNSGRKDCSSDSPHSHTVLLVADGMVSIFTGYYQSPEQAWSSTGFDRAVRMPTGVAVLPYADRQPFCITHVTSRNRALHTCPRGCGAPLSPREGRDTQLPAETPAAPTSWCRPRIHRSLALNVCDDSRYPKRLAYYQRRFQFLVIHLHIFVVQQLR